MTSQVSNRAVANKNNYIKSIARYLFENVNCSSNICKQQNRSGLGYYLIFPQCKTVRVGDVILKWNLITNL